MNNLLDRKMTFMLLVIFTVLALLASFWFGGHIASNQTAKSIYGVQANLSFGHLKSYEEIYSYLDSDCKSQAMEKLEFLIDGQKMLMAEYVQSTYDKKFEEYVSLRNSGLIEELRHYRVNWDKVLTTDGCKENQRVVLDDMSQ